MANTLEALESALERQHIRIEKTFRGQKSSMWYIQLFQYVYPHPDGSGTFATIIHDDLAEMQEVLLGVFSTDEEVNIKDISGQVLFKKE